MYKIGYISNVRSFITINVSEGYSDHPDRYMVFSVNTQRQAVAWKCGKHASNVTPVPEHLQPFLRQLTETVHNIPAKRTEAVELKRKREADDREAADKYYEANKERIDAERELTRKKMEGEKIKRKKQDAEKKRKDKLVSRKNELDHALRVMNWKVSAASQPAPAPAENPTETDEMRESAKRGAKHDLCEECSETLRFCAHKGCTSIGCTKCFEKVRTGCPFCFSVICGDHVNDFNRCDSCEILVCEPCGGQNCQLCGEFFCDDCHECQHCGIRLDQDDYGGDFCDDINGSFRHVNCFKIALVPLQYECHQSGPDSHRGIKNCQRSETATLKSRFPVTSK